VGGGVALPGGFPAGLVMFGLEPVSKERYIGGEFMPSILATTICRAVSLPGNGAGHRHNRITRQNHQQIKKQERATCSFPT
jgi:hypothetical protein